MAHSIALNTRNSCGCRAGLRVSGPAWTPLLLSNGNERKSNLWVSVPNFRAGIPNVTVVGRTVAQWTSRLVGMRK